MAELPASTTNKPYPDYNEWLVRMTTVHTVEDDA